MTMPGPDDIEHIKEAGPFAAAAATFLATVFGWFKWNNRRVETLNQRFSSKADSSRVDKCFLHIETLYENAERDRALTRDLHDKAMSAVAENQRLILLAIQRGSR